MRIGAAIRAAVKSTSKEWATYKRKKLRDERARYAPPPRWLTGERDLKDLAFEVMPAAYAQASGSVGLANARQIFYVARRLILAHKHRRPDAELKANYFTQTLLPQFIEEHLEETAEWDVVYDARGHLHEPHTRRMIGLGTLEVRDYVAQWSAGADNGGALKPFDASTFPTFGPAHRFRDVLFVEKEGFDPILQRAQIAERFDLAIMSTKGMSVTAARQLVEQLTLAGVRVLVLRDFDKAGFSIIGTLTRDTRRYQFKHRPNVVDLGLRLADVLAEDLPREEVTYVRQRDPAANLRQNGATEAEIAVLVTRPAIVGYAPARGERVELNAFTSDQFIAWLEKKLKKAGCRKVIPDTETLTTAYRRARYITEVNKHLKKLHKELWPTMQKASLPAGLSQVLRRSLRDDPTLPWDAAVARLAETKAEKGG